MQVVVGVRKNRLFFSEISGMVLFLFVALFVVFWFGYFSNYEKRWLKENGIEVEAEVYDIGWESHGNHIQDYYVDFYCKYKYVNIDGVEKTSTFGRFSTEKEAKARIGEKFIVTAGHDGLHISQSKEKIVIDFNGGLMWAIIITIPFLLSTFVFSYYGVYRTKLNKTLITKGLLTAGEVIKTVGFLLKDVKVKYIDNNGIEQQKWAGYLFRARDVKLLKNKKNIRILVYKNKFGIDEGFNAQK